MSGNRLRDQLSEHRSVLATGLLIVYVAFRVLSVSNWKVPTALAVVSSAGPVSVGIGALVSLIPLLALLAIVLGVAWLRVTWHSRKKVAFLA